MASSSWGYVGNWCAGNHQAITPPRLAWILSAARELLRVSLSTTAQGLWTMFRTSIQIAAALVALSAQILAFAAAPAPKPDPVPEGAIAFVHDSKIWVMGPDGKDRKALTDGHFRPSPTLHVPLCPALHSTYTFGYPGQADGTRGVTISQLDVEARQRIPESSWYLLPCRRYRRPRSVAGVSASDSGGPYPRPDQERSQALFTYSSRHWMTYGGFASGCSVEQTVAADRAGISVFRASTSSEPARQLNWGVRPQGRPPIMKLDYVPLLRLQRELHDLPRDYDRFRQYLSVVLNLARARKTCLFYRPRASSWPHSQPPCSAVSSRPPEHLPRCFCIRGRPSHLARIKPAGLY